MGDHAWRSWSLQVGQEVGDVPFPKDGLSEVVRQHVDKHQRIPYESPIAMNIAARAPLHDSQASQCRQFAIGGTGTSSVMPFGGAAGLVRGQSSRPLKRSLSWCVGR